MFETLGEVKRLEGQDRLDALTEWTDLLESGRWNQNQSALNGGGNFRCCLGVASDAAIAAGFGEWREIIPLESDFATSNINYFLELEGYTTNDFAWLETRLASHLGTTSKGTLYTTDRVTQPVHFDYCYSDDTSMELGSNVGFTALSDINDCVELANDHFLYVVMALRAHVADPTVQYHRLITTIENPNLPFDYEEEEEKTEHTSD